MFTYFIAFCLGGFCGVVTMCMCLAAGNADCRNGETHVPQQSCRTNDKNYNEKGDGKE